MTITFDATYSPEDNKLRLRASARLDKELYERVRAAGFIWAPKQDLFVAPMWTPAREDLLLELVDEIENEDISLAERAEERAERFDGYSDKREAEAYAAHDHVSRLADGIPMGQPILVGHHSERRARRDAERIRNGMAKAVRLWDTACYWEERAKGAMRHAEYKARAGVRERRIKGLEADQRKQQRELEGSLKSTRIWNQIAALEDEAKKLDHAKRFSNFDSGADVWSDLDKGRITAGEACERSLAMHQRRIERANRWLVHLANRLAYERVFLGRAPDEASPKPSRKPKGDAALPLLNYRAEKIEIRNPYHRGVTFTLGQVEMTAAEYAKASRGTGVSADGTHRVRRAYMPGWKEAAVFLTDSKVHPVPAPQGTTVTT